MYWKKKYKAKSVLMSISTLKILIIVSNFKNTLSPITMRCTNCGLNVRTQPSGRWLGLVKCKKQTLQCSVSEEALRERVLTCQSEQLVPSGVTQHKQTGQSDLLFLFNSYNNNNNNNFVYMQIEIRTLAWKAHYCRLLVRECEWPDTMQCCQRDELTWDKMAVPYGE